MSGYNPELFPNPSLSYQNLVLQAVALGEDTPDPPKDATIPKYMAIHKRVGGMLEEWNNLLDSKAYVLAGEETSGKRSRGDGNAVTSRATKKANLGVERGDFIRAAKDNSLSGYTVVQLMNFVKENDISVPSRATKKEVIDAVSAYAENQ